MRSLYWTPCSAGPLSQPVTLMSHWMIGSLLCHHHTCHPRAPVPFVSFYGGMLLSMISINVSVIILRDITVFFILVGHMTFFSTKNHPNTPEPITRQKLSIFHWKLYQTMPTNRLQVVFIDWMMCNRHLRLRPCFGTFGTSNPAEPCEIPKHSKLINFLLVNLE